MRQMRQIVGSVVLGGLLGVSAWGQEAPAVGVVFFDCAQVQFFGETCVAVPPHRESALTPVAPEASPSPAAADMPTFAPEPVPLFTPETVAVDTPPLLLRLFQEPTEANARAFLAWQQARLQRIQEVQALLQRLQAETPTRPVAPASPALSP